MQTSTSSGGLFSESTLAFDLQTALEKLLYTFGVSAGKKSFDGGTSDMKKAKGPVRSSGKLDERC